jgi:hydroxyacylglutathione hydrolase
MPPHAHYHFQVDYVPTRRILGNNMVDTSPYFIEQIPVGPLMVNCYLFGCKRTKQAIIIDPGDEAEKIIAVVTKQEAKITAIVLTHGHTDHLGAVNEIKEKYRCPIMIHEAEKETLTDPNANLSAFMGDSIICPPADRLLHDNDTIAVGDLELKVMHTPGHSPGGICLLYDKILFAGDLLFLMSIGRHDLPGGSYQQLESSVLTQVYKLPDDTIVFPGHGEKTTIGFEKRHNQFIAER